LWTMEVYSRKNNKQLFPFSDLMNQSSNQNVLNSHSIIRQIEHKRIDIQWQFYSIEFVKTITRATVYFSKCKCKSKQISAKQIINLKNKSAVNCKSKQIIDANGNWQSELGCALFSGYAMSINKFKFHKLSKSNPCANKLSKSIEQCAANESK
jgi:hypothetical protein